VTRPLCLSLGTGDKYLPIYPIGFNTFVKFCVEEEKHIALLRRTDYNVLDMSETDARGVKPGKNTKGRFELQ
jgi:hypothetical protein